MGVIATVSLIKHQILNKCSNNFLMKPDSELAHRGRIHLKQQNSEHPLIKEFELHNGHIVLPPNIEA